MRSDPDRCATARRCAEPTPRARPSSARRARSPDLQPHQIFGDPGAREPPKLAGRFDRRIRGEMAQEPPSGAGGLIQSKRLGDLEMILVLLSVGKRTLEHEAIDTLREFGESRVRARVARITEAASLRIQPERQRLGRMRHLPAADGPAFALHGLLLLELLDLETEAARLKPGIMSSLESRQKPRKTARTIQAQC